MALYLVGDIQGCFNELTALLKQVSFDARYDCLYLAGDLVARGPDSLATLRFVKSLGDSAKVVLGNHDLHLLSVYAGIKKVKRNDKLTELLAAHDINELMTWLAQQPLLQVIPPVNKSDSPSYMTHAGIAPQWSLEDAIFQAKTIQEKLSSTNRNKWLTLMYGEKPNSWHKAKTEIEKFRYSINALTRMRYCYEDGSLEFNQKDAPETSVIAQEQKLQPWYNLSSVIAHHTWIFGHWAALMGKSTHNNIYPLDTGCVWGSHLTLLRWHDKAIFTEQSHCN